MNKINNAIVKAAEPQAIKEALVSVFSDFEERTQKILVEKILGVYESPRINPTSTIAKDALLEHYNLISDRVTYSFTHTETRYFETQDKAEEFAAKGGFGGSHQRSETYQFEATRVSTRTDECYLSRWNGK